MKKRFSKALQILLWQNNKVTRNDKMKITSSWFFFIPNIESFQ